MTDNDNIKISVIMPLLNAEAHLEQAVSSFLEQTLKESELLCVDDGSTDTSLEILNSFQQQDARVKVFVQSNKGAGVARNLALSHARGSYVAFLDSDDFYPDSSTLEMVYDLAMRHQTKVAGGSLLFLDSTGISKAVLNGVSFSFSNEEIIEYCDLQQAYYYQRFIYSRKMLEAASITFPPYRRFQDVVFFVRAMFEAGAIAVTDKASYVYRKSDNFLNLNNEQICDMLQGYIDVLAFANEHGLTQLQEFLAKRLANGSSMSSMINTSIAEGNELARERFGTATKLAGYQPLAKRVAFVLDAVKRRVKGKREHN